MLDCNGKEIKVGSIVEDLCFNVTGVVTEIRDYSLYTPFTGYASVNQFIAAIKLTKPCNGVHSTSRYSENIRLIDGAEQSSSNKIEKVCSGCQKHNDMDVKVCWWCGGNL